MWFSAIQWWIFVFFVQGIRQVQILRVIVGFFFFFFSGWKIFLGERWLIKKKIKCRNGRLRRRGLATRNFLNRFFLLTNDNFFFVSEKKRGGGETTTKSHITRSVSKVIRCNIEFYKNAEGSVAMATAWLKYLLGFTLLRLLGRGTDIGKVGNDFLGVFSFSGTRLATGYISVQFNQCRFSTEE